MGYIEWGLYNEKEGSLNKIRLNTFDKSGNINDGYTTVDYTNTLIPKALKTILEYCEDRDLYFEPMVPNYN